MLLIDLLTEIIIIAYKCSVSLFNDTNPIMFTQVTI